MRLNEVGKNDFPQMKRTTAKENRNIRDPFQARKNFYVTRIEEKGQETLRRQRLFGGVYGRRVRVQHRLPQLLRDYPPG